MTFVEEIEQAINRHNKEADSNTPDFILALFLSDCLRAWNEAVQQRERWYERVPVPSAGMGDVPKPEEPMP